MPCGQRINYQSKTNERNMLTDAHPVRRSKSERDKTLQQPSAENQNHNSLHVSYSLGCYMFIGWRRGIIPTISIVILNHSCSCCISYKSGSTPIGTGEYILAFQLGEKCSQAQDHPVNLFSSMYTAVQFRNRAEDPSGFVGTWLPDHLIISYIALVVWSSFLQELFYYLNNIFRRDVSWWGYVQRYFFLTAHFSMCSAAADSNEVYWCSALKAGA